MLQRFLDSSTTYAESVVHSDHYSENDDASEHNDTWQDAYLSPPAEKLEQEDVPTSGSAKQLAPPLSSTMASLRPVSAAHNSPQTSQPARPPYIRLDKSIRGFSAGMERDS